MKRTRSIAIILLLTFFVTIFQSAIPIMAIEVSTKTEVKEEENLTREEKNLQATVKDNPKYKKVKVPYVSSVENTEEGLKITWDKIEGASYEIQIDGVDIKTVPKDTCEYILNDNSKLEKYVNFKVRAEVNGEKSNWSNGNGCVYKANSQNTIARSVVPAPAAYQEGIINLDTNEMVEILGDVNHKTATLKKNSKGYKLASVFRLYDLTIEPGATLYFETKEPLVVTGNLKIGDSNSKEKVNLIRNLDSSYSPMLSVGTDKPNDSGKITGTIENCNIVDKISGSRPQHSINVIDADITLKNNNIISQAWQAFGAENNINLEDSINKGVTAINNKIVTFNEGIVVKGAYVQPNADNTPNKSILVQENKISSGLKGVTFHEEFNNPFVTEYSISNNHLYGGDFTGNALNGLDLVSLSNINEKIADALKEASNSDITGSYQESQGVQIEVRNNTYATCNIKENEIRNYRVALTNTNGKLSYNGNKVFNAVEGIRASVDEFYIGIVSNFFGTNEFTLNENYAPIGSEEKQQAIGIYNSGEGLLKVSNANIKMKSNGIAIRNEGILEVSGLSKIEGANGDRRGAYNSNDSVGILNSSKSAYALISRSYVHNFNVSVKNTNGDLITSGLDSRDTCYPVVAIADKGDFREDSSVTIIQSNLIKKNVSGNGVNIINEGFKLVDAYVVYFEKMTESDIDNDGNFIYPKKVNTANDAIERSCYVEKDGQVSIDTIIYDEPIDITQAENLIDLTDQIPEYGLYRSLGNEGNDPATGNFGKTVEDFNSVFKYFDYNLSRTYNSLDDRDPGILGKGWRFSFQGSIENIEADDGKTKIKQVTLPNGSIVTFKEKLDENNKEIYEALDSRNTLAKNGDGYVLKTKEKLRYYFNGNNLLNQIADKNSNTVNIEYNENKTIKRIIDMRKSELVFNYLNNSIESIVEKINGKEIKKVKYSVISENGTKLLKKFTNSYGKEFYYDYDSNNQLKAIRTAEETLEEVVYNGDKKVNYHIDINNNKLSYEYDTVNRQTVITDLNGFKIIERYDRNNLETFSSYSDGTSVVTTYNLEEGKNKYGEIKKQKDRSGLTRSYERDSEGNVTKELVNSKVIKEYAYDDDDNKKAEKSYLDDKKVLRTFYEYDGKGNVAKELTPRTFDTADYTVNQNIGNYIVKSYAYKDYEYAKGVLVSEIDSKGSINYTYDNRGNIATETNHYGAKKTYTYNDLDLIAEEIQQNGNKVKSYYSNNGDLIKKVVEVDPFKGNNDKEPISDFVERYEYDKEGNKTKEIYGDLYNESKEKVQINDIKKIYTDYGYSGDSNIINTYYKNNKVKSEVRKVTDKQLYTSNFKYDVYGNISEEIKADGAKYSYKSDDQGRVLETYISENGVNVLLESTSYDYTGDGGYTKKFKKYIDNNNSIDTITTYNYLDKELEVVDGEVAVSKTEYDLSGNIIRKVDPKSYETVYKYNTQNKLESTYKNVSNYKNEKEEVTNYYQTIYYTYDDLGNMSEMKKGMYDVLSLDEVAGSLYVEKYIRKYDTSSKTETVTTEYGKEYGEVFTKDKNSGKKETFNYNGNKIKEELTYEEGKAKTIEYVNTLDGKVREKIESVLESDLVDGGSNSKEIKLTTSYLYDARGQVSEVISKSYDSYKGFTIKYGYDYQGRQVDTAVTDNSDASYSLKSSKTYNIYNDVTVSIDSNNNKVINEYDQRGRLTKVRALKIDGTEEVTAYEYDNADRLIREVSPENYISNKALNTLSRTEYVRDKLGRVLAEIQIGKTNSADVANKAIEYKGKAVVTKAYEYDVKGNVIKEVDGNNFPELALTDNYLVRVDELKAKIKSLPGKEIRYFGDDKIESYLTAENQDEVSIQSFDGVKCDEKYVYDGMGYLRSTYKGDKTNISYDYDLYGNITKVILRESDGKSNVIQSNKYDGLSRLVEKIDGEGYKTTLTYNALDKVRTETYEVEKGNTEINTNVYGTEGNLIKWSNTKGQFEESIYDNLGRKVEIKKGNKDGSVTINKVENMDGNGNILSILDANNNRTESKYDEKNRAVEVKRTTEEGTNQITNYKYDSKNNISLEDNLIQKSEGNISVTKKIYNYDDFGKLIKEVSSDGEVLKEYAYTTGSQPTIVKDGSTNTIILEYDKDNRVISETDAVGGKKSYEYSISDSRVKSEKSTVRTRYYSYNARGNLTKVDEGAGVASLRKTVYDYDLNGNLIKQAEGVTGYSTSNNVVTYNAEKTTKYEYNGLNKVTGKVYDDNSKETYAYNSDGNLNKSVDRMGNITSYNYDVLNYLNNRVVENKDHKILDNITYSNDNLGNIKEVINNLNNGLKEVVKEYDSTGRVVSEKTTDKTSKDNNAITKKYDILSFNKSKYKDTVVADKTVTSNNTVISKAYDKNGRLKYVVNGDIAKDDAKVIATYNYGDGNKVSSLVHGDNSKIEYSYYSDNNVNTIINKDPSNKILESYKYNYDLDDNPRVLTKEKDGIKEIQQYNYDKLNRLDTLNEITINNGEQTQKKTTFKYNLLNDVLQTVESRPGEDSYIPVYETNYNYTNHRLTEQTSNSLVDNTSLKTKFIYDSNGNLCTTQNSNETKSYGYDGLNRLISANVDGTLVKYGYNGLDKKVSKTVGSNITSLIYDNNNAIEEVLNDKLNGTTYYGQNALYRNDVQAKTGYYYFYNTHNDVTDLRLNGETKTSYKYDAFGKEVAISGENNTKVNNPIRYAGYYFEEESDLYYLNARMYNPDIKRFMQQDTVIGDVQDPNTLNQYAYSGNNPITNYDPSGEFFETLFDVVGLAMSVYDFIKEPSLINAGMLAWDVVSLIPGVPGSYVAKGAKYADRLDDAYDTAKALDKVDDVYDGVKALDKADDVYDGVKALDEADDVYDGMKALDNAGDIAKRTDNIRDLSQAAKGGRDVLEEVTERLMKSGDDIMQNGSIVATSARKAAEKGKIALAKVKTKISSVKSKISSSVKTSMDKAKFAGAETRDNIKLRAKKAGESEGIFCKAKTFMTNKTSCFTEDTLVKTEEGLKAIGDLKVGDKVYSVDEDNVYEEANLKEIKQVVESQTDTLVKLKIDGEEIKTTETHPFYIEGKGFTDAEYIVVGDKVRTAEGEIKVVEAKEVEKLDEAITVYNLEVEDNRTYYVGSEEILVHNMCAKATKGVSNPKALKEFDIAPYGDFKKYPNDNLTGHELLQNAWLESNGKIVKRGKGISKDNPAMALYENPMHKYITGQQKSLGLNKKNLAGTSWRKNVLDNIQIMKDAGVPRDRIAELAWQTRRFAIDNGF